MDREQIKRLALDSGFKLKTQADGSEDLNEYVYAFATALLDCQKLVKDKLPLKPLVWHDASGVDGVYSERTESYIKDALWVCNTLVAEYVVKKSTDHDGYVVNYGGRVEKEFSTIEGGKDWAEFRHYPSQMRPYVLTLEEIKKEIVK